VSTASTPTDQPVAVVAAPDAPDAPAVPPTAAPTASIAGVDVFTTPEGQEHARQQAEQMPVYTPIGEGFLGVDPAQLVVNAIEPLVPALPGANP
jgi:hypothetical protein